MPPGSNPEKYAEALMLLAEAAGRISTVASDLSATAEAMRDNPDLLRFLADDLVKPQGKQEALSEIFSGRIDPVLALFLRILQVDRRTSQIQDIAREFAELLAAREHRASGEVVSAIPLPQDKIKEIEVQASKILQKEVSLASVVDPSMIGGVIVRVGNFIIDGSVEKELSRARTALTQ